MQIRLGALQLGAPRLDAPADTAEEIKLPEGVEPGVVQLGSVRGAGGALSRGYALLGVAAARRHGWRQIEERLTACSASFHQPCERDAQIVVGRQRVIDEVVESVVAKLCPELRLCLVRRVHRGLGAGELGRNGRIGPLVVWPDGAACERRRDHERNAALEKRVKHFVYPGREYETLPLPAAPAPHAVR